MKGLCQCGCGGRTPIATGNDRRRGFVKGEPRRFIPGHHKWKGGRHLTSDGYVWVFTPGHPRASKDKYVREHILLAEKAIGKPLRRSAEVHHVDGNKQNNAPGNLVACNDHAYHALLHQRQDALNACGNPSARRCSFCQNYENQTDMVIRKDNKSHHRECFNAYYRVKVKSA